MVTTPIAASEKLAQVIADTFDPIAIEKYLLSLIYNLNVRQNLQSTVDSLFAKERENIWRDELYQWKLYIRILSTSWSRQMSMEFRSQDSQLEDWITEVLLAMKLVAESKVDTPLGWSHDVDVFETVMKIILLADVLLRYGRGGKLIGALEEVRDSMTERESHEFWVEKIERICCTRMRITN